MWLPGSAVRERWSSRVASNRRITPKLPAPRRHGAMAAPSRPFCAGLCKAKNCSTSGGCDFGLTGSCAGPEGVGLSRADFARTASSPIYPLLSCRQAGVLGKTANVPVCVRDRNTSVVMTYLKLCRDAVEAAARNDAVSASLAQLPAALHVAAAQALPARSLVAPSAVMSSGDVCAAAWRSLGRAAASAHHLDVQSV